jgi:NADH-quinone oxidoreductase subunit F
VKEEQAKVKQKIRTTKQLQALSRKLVKQRKQTKTWVVVSSGTCGQARGSEDFIASLRLALKRHKLDKKVGVRVTGCIGFCETEPNLVLMRSSAARHNPRGTFYQKLKPEDAEEIVQQTILKGKVIERLLHADPRTGKRHARIDDIPFYAKQNRLVSGNNALVEPTSIADYIAIGGYASLARVLAGMRPEKVIDEVKKSGLRGRGGAGFPTGLKWETCRTQPGGTRYVICNADEGDPGAYMDRSLLEGNPHAIIEGMIIGAYAIGATRGYIYVRTEYPLAIKHVETAIRQARAMGLLGKNILGAKLSFDIDIARGAGAFVCGEETALMASMEGKPGIPRQRPPFPAQRGLYGKPTNINNVETWATVPHIVRMGGAEFARIGTETSKGTKIFSLVGKIRNTGLVEVPMGISLREIVEDIGGGVPAGKKVKAVQTGGPSGGCIPARLLNLPVDFESLGKVGSIMGSGGMIVMDQDTCMVDVAKYFMNFLRDESCGKCTSCREGTLRLWEILDKITKGQGAESDQALLEELAGAVKDASMCGLGQTAANPVLSTLRYFQDEYDAHIKEKRCPAKLCKELVNYYIVPDKCQGCNLCAKNCPAGAIAGKPRTVYLIDQAKCTKCGVCLSVCPEKWAAVTKLSGEPIPKPVNPGTPVKRLAGKN